MDHIIRRLFENREILNTSIFSIKNNSEESWDLYDKIQEIVAKECRKLFGEEINIDDSGLDSSGNTDGNRTITYRASIFYFKKNKEVSLNKKEATQLETALKDIIKLPLEDGEYDYSISINYVDNNISIKLKKEEKL